MASSDSATGSTLDDVLKGVPRSMPEESILLTGVILPAESPDRFTLQSSVSSRSVFSVFRKSDVIGPVMVVPTSLLPLSETGTVIHAVRVRKGAPGILFSESTYRVGDEPRTPAILAEYSSGQSLASVAVTYSSLDEIVQKAPKTLLIGYGVFPGVIYPGPEKDEILLQVNPPGNLDYAIIKRADIVDPGVISELPQDSLPLSKRGHRIHLVRVREGSTIRAISGMQARVEREPRDEGGCGCSGEGEMLPSLDDDPLMQEPEPGERRGHSARGPRYLAGGRRCRTTVCRNENGKWDYCCANEWDPCDYQWATGVCTTATHWLWGKRCFCAAKWAPL